MQNISLRSSGTLRKQKSAFSPPYFFCFSCFLFFFCCVFSRLHFGGKSFYYLALRILRLDERKGRWVVEQDFHGNFRVNVTWFFAFFFSVLDWTVLILVWFERSLHSAHVSRQSCPRLLKLMTSQVVERTWICTGSYRQLRGEWVNVVSLSRKSPTTRWLPKPFI